MCGIAGFTHSNSSTSRARIEDAIASLVHRGPDQQGFFRSDFVAMGAARLKIIDLKAGDQPIISADGDVVIAFNGEIYNNIELRNELLRLGHKFRSDTDTETVLEAFREWDLDCFGRFRGMFAVALWTESRRRLVLARDRLGIKPLYVAQPGRHILFGSEMKTILLHPEIERTLSPQGLDCYLALNYVPSPWTLVDGVEKLRPGYWLEWIDGKTRSETYWKLPLTSPGNWNLNSAREELDILLQQSVREHLISDVPLGVWLSGGIDSSTILHYATKASSRPLKTFSVTFNGRSFDESAYIKQVADIYGTEHQQLNIDEDLALPDTVEEFAYYCDDPNGDAGAVPVWYLSELTKGSATVALSGEGADEIFGGYLTYRADEIARQVRRSPRRLLQVAGQLAEKLPVSDEKIGIDYKLKRFLAGAQMTPERAHVFWNGTFSDSEKQSLLNAPSPSGLNGILSDLQAAGTGLKAFLWFDQKYFLPDDILAKVDRISMAHSLEVRPPFLDHRIVEFAASLPAKLLVDGSRQKVILKETMKDKLPSAVLRRKKIGLDIPAHQWLRGPLRPLLLDTLASGLLEHSALFRRNAIEHAVDQHLNREKNLGYNLWGLMILFLWMRKWKIQAVPALRAKHAVSGGSFTPI